MAARVTVFRAIAIAQARRISTPRRRQIAEQMIVIAESQAAVLTGQWQASYSVEQNGDQVFAVNNDPAAIYIAFGTEDTPPHDELIEAGKQFGTYSGWEPRG